MYEVRKSRAGRGLFAVRGIEKGECIVEYTGPRIPTAHADTLKTRYLFDLEDGWTIDGSVMTNDARWINHSCNPNCEAMLRDGRIFLHALRGIAPGEELTFDYGEEYFDEFIRPIGCRCEACC